MKQQTNQIICDLREKYNLNIICELREKYNLNFKSNIYNQLPVH